MICTSPTNVIPGGSAVKNLPTNTGDLSSIPWVREIPGKRNGNPPQYSCLENPMEPCGLQSMGSQRVRRDSATKEQQPHKMKGFNL